MSDPTIHSRPCFSRPALTASAVSAEQPLPRHRRWRTLAPDGRHGRATCARRFVPQPERFPTLQEQSSPQGERLD